MTTLRRARTRKAGYTGSMNEQDLPMPTYTPAERAARLRHAATQFVGMVQTWGNGRKAEAVAKAAALALVDELKREAL